VLLVSAEQNLVTIQEVSCSFNSAETDQWGCGLYGKHCVRFDIIAS
jgi:hypothetical protein